MKKKVKENTDYIKTESGAVILDSKSKYIEYMNRLNASKKETQRVSDLENEVAQLKELVQSLIEK